MNEKQKEPIDFGYEDPEMKEFEAVFNRLNRAGSLLVSLRGIYSIGEVLSLIKGKLGIDIKTEV